MTSRSMGPRGEDPAVGVVPSTQASTGTRPRPPGASQPPPHGGHLAEVREYLHGTNHRIGSAAAMVKTARVI
jgi:hypothetical protein